MGVWRQPRLCTRNLLPEPEYLPAPCEIDRKVKKKTLMVISCADITQARPPYLHPNLWLHFENCTPGTLNEFPHKVAVQ